LHFVLTKLILQEDELNRSHQFLELEQNRTQVINVLSHLYHVSKKLHNFILAITLSNLSQF